MKFVTDGEPYRSSLSCQEGLLVGAGAETTEPAAGGTRDLLATEKEKAPHAETEKSERGAVTKETAETVA